MTLTWFECSTSTIRQILDICKEYKEFELQNLTSCEKTQPPKTPSQKGNDIKGQGNNSKDNNKKNSSNRKYQLCPIHVNSPCLHNPTELDKRQIGEIY